MLARACVFGTDSSCAFQCHCDHGTCDPDTGVCPDGQCAEDEPSLFTWSGESCQIGNVARGKSTSQTEQLMTYVSEFAVDGHVIDVSHPDQDTTCAHPHSNKQATWTVYLWGDYSIYDVTVFNTNDATGGARLYQFDVVVSGGPSGSSVCGNRTAVVPQANISDPLLGSANITCNDHPVGKYVTIHRTGGHEVGDMTLCEVVVIGHKYISCDQCPGGQNCSSVTGCPACPAGYKRPDCTQACNNGFYGANCSERCSGLCDANDPSDCNHVNGSCPGDCQAWYTGTTCATWIRRPDDNGENVTVVIVDSSRVEVTWEQNKDLPSGVESHYGYRVSYKTVGTSSFTDGAEVQHDSGTTWRMATVSGLEHNTQYEFRVVQFRTWRDRKEVGASLYAPVIKTAFTRRTTTTPDVMDNPSGRNTTTPDVIDNPSVEASNLVPYALLGCSLAVVLVLVAMLGVAAHRHGGCRDLFKEGRPPKKVATQAELSQSDQSTGSHVSNYTARPSNDSVALSADRTPAPDLDQGGDEELRKQVSRIMSTWATST